MFVEGINIDLVT